MVASYMQALLSSGIIESHSPEIFSIPVYTEGTCALSASPLTILSNEPGPITYLGPDTY